MLESARGTDAILFGNKHQEGSYWKTGLGDINHTIKSPFLKKLLTVDYCQL